MNDVIEMAQTDGALTALPASPVGATLGGSVTPADLLRHAMESGADLDRLERLMDLQDRWEANLARKAFAEAMIEFKKNPPKVYKDKHVDFKTEKGRTQYDHATIGNANNIIIAALAEHGFAHRWITTQPGGKVVVECVITHRLGHSQSNILESAPDKSGGKNDIQAIISARSYLERHSLFDATGLASLDGEDDDGRRAELDTSLADEWIAKVNAAPTDAEVLNVWNVGVAVIEKAQDRNAYNEFKEAVAKRRAQLVPA